MNNIEKKTFAKNQIETAIIELLKDHEINELTIGDIASKAQVSKNAFYRNYKDKEDIIHSYLHNLYQSWKRSFKQTGSTSNNDLYGSLFAHLKENEDTYLLLEKRHLFHIFHQVMMEDSGPKPEDDNLTAYLKAFITRGTLGWIEEWIARGMQESADTMVALLTSTNIK